MKTILLFTSMVGVNITLKFVVINANVIFFERFLEDHKAFKGSEKGEEKLSGSLITLRSAQLLWQQGEGKGEPWKVHKLALHCTYDARLWTAEGTEKVRKEKTDKTQNILAEFYRLILDNNSLKLI